MANGALIDALSTPPTDNLWLYNKLRTPPPEALKGIAGGRLKGMTDINAMWRIKAVTEAFGPCGTGWKYEIVRLWLEPGANGEISAFAQINLYYRDSGGWSEAIPGIGGSAFVAKERNGLYTSDECYKMAVTDALSVACKAIGTAADVYWEKDHTKYGAPAIIPEDGPLLCKKCGKEITDADYGGSHYTAEEVNKNTGGRCFSCYRKGCAGK